MEKLSVAYLTIDMNNANSRARHYGLNQAGAKTTHFTFTLSGKSLDMAQTPQDTVIVGNAKIRNLPSRLYAIIRIMLLALHRPELFRDVDIFICRNMDMAIAGFILKCIFGGLLVYEVLDIHRLCTRKGLLGKIAKFVDRWILKKSSLLVTSSPGFVKFYFSKLGYDGKIFLLENKVTRLPLTDSYWLNRRGPVTECSGGKPIVIGYFGKLRCKQSIEILANTAIMLGGRLRVVLGGVPDDQVKDILNNVKQSCKYIEDKGPYRSPEDLEQLYRSVHLTWCIDLSDSKNGAWLVPNRLYEGGLFGIPAIAASETETGRIVKEEKLGVCLDAPISNTLVDFIKNLTDISYDVLVSRVENVPVSRFLDLGQHVNLVRELSNLADQRFG
jgi:succinoglycan biosynthesis protein ExoL